MKYAFPATFKVDATDPKFVNVCFPDIPGAVTFGEGMDDAKKMAKDLLNTMLDEDFVKHIKPTNILDATLNFKDCDVEMVEVDK